MKSSKSTRLETLQALEKMLGKLQQERDELEKTFDHQRYVEQKNILENKDEKESELRQQQSYVKSSQDELKTIHTWLLNYTPLTQEAVAAIQKRHHRVIEKNKKKAIETLEDKEYESIVATLLEEKIIIKGNNPKTYEISADSLHRFHQLHFYPKLQRKLDDHEITMFNTLLLQLDTKNISLPKAILDYQDYPKKQEKLAKLKSALQVAEDRMNILNEELSAIEYDKTNIETAIAGTRKRLEILNQSIQEVRERIKTIKDTPTLPVKNAEITQKRREETSARNRSLTQDAKNKQQKKTEELLGRGSKAPNKKPEIDPNKLPKRRPRKVERLSTSTPFGSIKHAVRPEDVQEIVRRRFLDPNNTRNTRQIVDSLRERSSTRELNPASATSAADNESTTNDVAIAELMNSFLAMQGNRNLAYEIARANGAPDDVCERAKGKNIMEAIIDAAREFGITTRPGR